MKNTKKYFFYYTTSSYLANDIIMFLDSQGFQYQQEKKGIGFVFKIKYSRKALLLTNDWIEKHEGIQLSS